jgi:flagellar biosynthesis/type III secretory pathway protein FliH
MPYLNDFDSYDPNGLSAEILDDVKEAISGVDYAWDDELTNEENLEQFLDKIVEELDVNDNYDLTDKIVSKIYNHCDELMDEVYDYGYDAGSESGYDNGYEEGRSEYYNLESEFDDLRSQYDSLEEDFSELEREVDDLRELKEKQDALEELDLNEVRQSILDDLRAELESSDLDDVL